MTLCPDCRAPARWSIWRRLVRIEPHKRLLLARCSKCPAFWCEAIEVNGVVR